MEKPYDRHHCGRQFSVSSCDGLKRSPKQNISARAELHATVTAAKSQRERMMNACPSQQADHVRAKFKVIAAGATDTRA
ncbi:hypothetical protein ACLKA7_007033 [Drosophila subpalustris]